MQHVGWRDETITEDNRHTAQQIICNTSLENCFADMGA